MGRLPATWANRTIVDRDPYDFTGTAFLTTAQQGFQYPPAVFSNGVDKPFEIHRMIPRIYAIDGQNVLLPSQPDQELLAGLVQITINNLAKNQLITKTPTLIGTLTKGTNERTWEFAEPMYLVRSENLEITLDALTFPTITNLAQLKVVLTFEGFLCVVAPPGGNR
jgi:hypothetical protein